MNHTFKILFYRSSKCIKSLNLKVGSIIGLVSGWLCYRCEAWCGLLGYVIGVRPGVACLVILYRCEAWCGLLGCVIGVRPAWLCCIGVRLLGCAV